MFLIIEDRELSTTFQDAGPWRSYYLSTEGTCLMDCMSNAVIYEVDQDGGEMGSFALSDANNDLLAEGADLIMREWRKLVRKS